MYSTGTSTLRRVPSLLLEPERFDPGPRQRHAVGTEPGQLRRAAREDGATNARAEADKLERYPAHRCVYPLVPLALESEVLPMVLALVDPPGSQQLALALVVH